MFGTPGLLEGGRGGAPLGFTGPEMLCVVGLGLGDTLGDEFRLEDEELWKGLSKLFGFEGGPPPNLFAGEAVLSAGFLPVETPPDVFFSVGIPPANKPPMPGRGPGAAPPPPPPTPPPPP